VKCLLLALSAAVFLLAAPASSAAEGFGMITKVVPIERLSPPQVILPVKRIALVFNDETKRAAALRQRIEADLRAGDPQMAFASNAPYVVTVRIRNFLTGNTQAIDGTVRITDRADRELYEGEVLASNAGAIISDSDGKLIATAARDVVRLLVPQHDHTMVVVPKGRLDSLIKLAEKGDWPAYLSAAEHLPALRGEDEAYREYALAVGHEGTAFQWPDLEARIRHLHEAVTHNLAAARLKPSEKLFVEDYAPMSRAFDTPGLVPKRWTDPHSMELWESLALVQKWMNAPRVAVGGLLDNRRILELLAAGRTDDAILAEIDKAAHVTFSLERPDMAALHAAGVPWGVIDAMRSKAGLPRRAFWMTPDTW
jgi:hypothetical protein